MKENRLALLMECHEREILGQDPMKATDARSVKTLIEKKYVIFSQHQPKAGPPYVAVTISAAGKLFLKNKMRYAG